MAETMKIPAFVTRLVETLQGRIRGAEVDVERVGRTDRYRLAIIASQFRRMDHPKRQNLVWDLAEQVLKPEELLRVSMILTLQPEDVVSLSAAKASRS